MQKMQPTILIVDRIEGDIAVCEVDISTYLDVPLSTLPEGAKEGSVLRLVDGVYVVDKSEEHKRKMRIEQKAQRLFVRR